MIQSTNARAPVLEILVGGVAGGVLGGNVTLALAIGFADSFVLAAVMGTSRWKSIAAVAHWLREDQ